MASSSTMHEAFITSTRTTPASVGDLPLELHQQILSYLPWRDQLNCEHVCKAWREDLRGRLSEPRSIVAPWLPSQDFDLGLYDALTVHTLITNGLAFNFKCREGYKLYPGAPIVADYIFHELGDALTDDNGHIEPVQCISEFNFLEKVGKGADAIVKECPLANLSFLDDMLVIPAFVDEDEIKKLYCRFNRHELVEPQEEEEGDKNDENAENTDTSNQMAVDNNNDDGDDGDGDGNDDDDDDNGDNGDDSSDDEDGNSTGPTRTIVSSGNFTTNVNLNPDGSSTGLFYRLTLGALLVKIRENLLNDVFRLQGIDANNGTYPADLGGEEIMQLDVERAQKRKEYEIGTVIIEQLQFERCRENQALSISFNGMLVPEKAVDPVPAETSATAAASEH
ncbi:hypothetical protein TWF281_009807 [Arthrobotrys megalospora]